MISPDTTSVPTYGPIALSKNTGPGSLAGGRLVGLLAEGNWVAIRDGRVRADAEYTHPHPPPARSFVRPFFKASAAGPLQSRVKAVEKERSDHRQQTDN